MTHAHEYEAEIRSYTWERLQELWQAIQRRNTPSWQPGKAFEYLVLRAFELNQCAVRWPYTVPLFGEDIEQIDGSVQVAHLYGLVETKDESGNISIAPIAKLRNQLLRRPSGAVGLLFSSSQFTEPAVQIAHFALTQAILLWTGDDVTFALEKRDFARACLVKYRYCIDIGSPDYRLTKGDF